MKGIVFINQWTNPLTKDIVNAFAEKLEDIKLVAGTISETGSTINKKVKIIKIFRYNRKSVFSRQISWLFATIQAIILVITRFRKYHLFLTTNPPTISFLTLFCSNKYSVLVLDIFPDALVVAGFISKKSWINKIWEKHNRKYLANADHIFTLTGGMAGTISKYCNPDKIEVIPPWSSSNGYSHIEKSHNEFIKMNSLEDRFIVMYSGNIGLGHHVATIVESARVLKDNKEILFVIIGEGWNKSVIENLIKEYGLGNCLVLPFQSPSMFKHSIQAADLGVVSVSKELASVCVPSKIYNLINNQIPMIFITEGQSELTVLESKYDIGKCFTPEQYNEISNFIIKVKSESDTFLKYKMNLQNCSDNFTSKNAYIFANSVLE